MELDALATPGTIAYTALIVLATFVLTRHGRCPDVRDQIGVGHVSAEADLRAGDCAWKVRALSLVDHTCTIHVSGTQLRLRRGDLLLALRPQPRGSGSGDPPTPRPPRADVESGAERLPCEIGHDIEDRRFDSTGIEQGQDVGMLEVGGGLDLLQESLGTNDGRDLGAEHLDRDFAIVAHVVREVDRGPASGAQLALEGVAVGQGDPETIQWRGHHLQDTE